MAGTTVRVKAETHQALRDLARQSKESLQEVLAKAVESYRRQRILELTNLAYEALRANPDLWREVESERAVWDNALADDLGQE